MNHDEERVRKLPISILLHLSSEDEQKYLVMKFNLNILVFIRRFTSNFYEIFFR